MTKGNLLREPYRGRDLKALLSGLGTRPACGFLPGTFDVDSASEPLALVAWLYHAIVFTAVRAL